MEECDALFFYQLLLPIVYLTLYGIEDDPQMWSYEEVVQLTNLHAVGLKNHDGTRGHQHCNCTAAELLVWE